jgi:hypothetical protein
MFPSTTSSFLGHLRKSLESPSPVLGQTLRLIYGLAKDPATGKGSLLSDL